MKSIAEIFDNSKDLLESITSFVDKYIGTSPLRKCNITKTVDSISESTVYEYMRIIPLCVLSVPSKNPHSLKSV